MHTRPSFPGDRCTKYFMQDNSTVVGDLCICTNQMTGTDPEPTKGSPRNNFAPFWQIQVCFIIPFHHSTFTNSLAALSPTPFPAHTPRQDHIVFANTREVRLARKRFSMSSGTTQSLQEQRSIVDLRRQAPRRAWRLSVLCSGFLFLLHACRKEQHCVVFQAKRRRRWNGPSPCPEFAVVLD